MKIPSALLLLLLGLPAAAQVRVDKPIVLTGEDEASRQVQGLPQAEEPGQALDAATLQSGAAHWAGDAPAAAAWALTLPSLEGAPEPGLALVVRTQGAQAGEVTLSLNGSAPYPVILGPGMPLLADDLADGMVVALVFDGTSFQATNGVGYQRRSCVEGTVEVTDHFCIEPDEHPLATWYQAARTCVQQGMRLCTWGEWQRACQLRDALGLNDMLGDWEWSNNTANEDFNVRMMGNVACSSAATKLATEQLVFRCCYTR